MILIALRWTASNRSAWDLVRVGCHSGDIVKGIQQLVSQLSTRTTLLQLCTVKKSHQVHTSPEVILFLSSFTSNIIRRWIYISQSLMQSTCTRQKLIIMVCRLQLGTNSNGLRDPGLREYETELNWDGYHLWILTNGFRQTWTKSA